jgi:hypothetical protein
MKLSARLLIGSVMAACAALSAQQPAKTAQPAAQQVVYHPVFRTNLDPALFENPAEAILLFKNRETVISNLLAERKKIITSDRRAKELHQQIMKLNRELAVLMENKRAVRDLNRELQAIDTKINTLKLKNKNTKQGNKK